MELAKEMAKAIVISAAATATTIGVTALLKRLLK